jgi:hypothetical protein
LIYICIPTHNEQQTVGVVLWKLRQVLTDFHRDYQLLVADDASTDRTTEVLEPYTRVLPLTVIRSDHRQGYAASLEMLLREAVRRSEYPKRDVIVTLQADFSEEPDDIVGLIKRMEAGADLAVGIKVSSGKESRTRRLARSLSSFFARKQAWPEGVMTPFDGYRAYRLHAVKRAMEEREGKRLLRYDGWAGHAELLRAMLPHARRIDTLNVEDRPDRLQRPRRERPFASAWQVRAMAAGAEPAGLASVEDLDRIAATASRSRDRFAVGVSGGAAQPRGNGGSRRPSQARTGAARTARSGESGQTGTGGTVTRSPRGERPAASGRGGSEERGRRERPPRPPKAEPQDAAAGTAAEPTEAQPKKRRRRRSKGKSREGAVPVAGSDTPASSETSVGGEAQAEAAEPDTAAAPTAATGESEGNGDDGASTERRRRRRGGRRGGRGRRRGPRAEGSEVSEGGDAEPTGVAATAPARGRPRRPTRCGHRPAPGRPGRARGRRRRHQASGIEVAAMKRTATATAAAALVLGLAMAVQAQVRGSEAPGTEPSVAAVPFGPGEKGRIPGDVRRPGQAGRGIVRGPGRGGCEGPAGIPHQLPAAGGVLGMNVNDVQESWLDVGQALLAPVPQDLHQVRYERLRTLDFFPAEGCGAGRRRTSRARWPRICRWTTSRSCTGRGRCRWRWAGRTSSSATSRTRATRSIIRVLRRQTVTVPAGTFNTIVVKPLIRTSGLFSEGGEAEVYYHGRRRRMIVMVKTKFSIANMTMQLESYRPVRSSRPRRPRVRERGRRIARPRT